MRLSAKSLNGLTLPPGKSEAFYWDDDLRGFGLRISAGGRRSWICQYRIGGQQRRVTIGDATAIAPADARERAREILAKARLGQDYQAQMREAEERQRITLGAVTELYISRKVEGQQRSARDSIRYLRHYFRVLHELPVERVTRRHVAVRLSEIADEHGPVTANRARAAMHAMLTWAMKQGLVETNAAAGTAKAVPERPRERVLSPDEIRSVWQTLAEDAFSNIVRLLLLTGQRREEVAAMRWSELDLDRALWSLPSSRTKNRRPHDVPLSRQAMAVIRSVPVRDRRDLLFGDGRGPFSGFSAAKRRLDVRSGVSGWRLHDLRRVAVTEMGEIGIKPHVVEAVVNHSSGHRAGVAGIYNRATYAAEKRIALQAWGDHLEKLCAEDATSIGT